MTEAKFSFTTKVDGDLFTVRADSPSEFVDNLVSSMSDALDAARSLQAAARGAIHRQDAQQQAVAVATAGLPVAHSSTITAGVVGYQQTPSEYGYTVQATTPPPVDDIGMPVPTPATGIEKITDKFGNVWTYGLPTRHVTPRGPMILKEGKGKNAPHKPYKGWFDPAKGPRWSGDRNPADMAEPQWDA